MLVYGTNLIRNGRKIIMINDPYSILGISANASDDEVKKAYRDLSRKYHPDNVANNPLADLAEEKFKEVQEAYKQIMDMREHGGQSYGSSSYGGSPYGGGSSSYSGDDAARFNSVRVYLNARQFSQALSALSGISNRNAEWHFLYGYASLGLGNNIEALNHAQTAVQMDPGNGEYKAFLNQLQMGGQRYQGASMFGGRPGYSAGDMCCDLWCADTLCECMGGDLCSCM